MSRPPLRSEQLQKLPTLQDCVHCGLCLPACPTYLVTGKEVQSPRGRIAALRAFAEERVEPTPGLQAGLDDCLVCRACESHCPSGISMEDLMSGYRAEQRASGLPLPGRERRWRSRLESWALRRLIPFPRRLQWLTRGARWLHPLLRRNFELPRPERLRVAGPPQGWPPRHPVRGRVALLRGCVADLWFRQEAAATARVLAFNGFEVSFASGCCGALQRHAGLVEDARRLVEAAASSLEQTSPDYVVMEAAGCAPALAHPISTDPKTLETAARVREPLQLLADAGWTPPSTKLAGQWFVAPPCHHRHGPLPETGTQAVLHESLEVGYQELPGPEHCCGAAGFYVARRPDLSRAIGAVAAERLEHSGATGLVTGNPGCLLRWENIAPAGVEVLHPVQLLDRAYREAGDYDKYPGFRDGA